MSAQRLCRTRIGLRGGTLSALPAYKRELQREGLGAACAAQVDALAAIYHSEHRELCAHQRECPFRILNVLEIVGESRGLHRGDRYK